MTDTTDSDTRIAAMMRTGKIRVNRERLRTATESGRVEPDILILVSDLERFLEAVQSDPSFENVDLNYTEADFNKNESADTASLLIRRNELPGHLVTGRLTLEQFETLISWNCVEQAEEKSISHLE